MNDEKLGTVIGVFVLVLGIMVLGFVLFSAIAFVQEGGDYFREQFPELTEEEAEGPSAEFSWNSDNLTVWFNDESEEGDVPITSWDWSFGDGSTSQDRYPMHTYSEEREYKVKLRVKDENGSKSTAYADIQLEGRGQNNGFSESGFGDFGIDFDIGNIILPLAVAFVVGILYIVMFLVGASITKAGWNLIKPRPETVKVRIKPKHLEAEPVAPTPSYNYPQQTAEPTPVQPSAAPTALASEGEYTCPGCGTLVGATIEMCPNCGLDFGDEGEKRTGKRKRKAAKKT